MKKNKLKWFAYFADRMKTTGEWNIPVYLDGQQFGTHKLILIKTRSQGEDPAGGKV